MKCYEADSMFRTMEKKLLRILYFLREVRKDDLYLYGRSLVFECTVSDAYHHLLANGWIEEERIHSSSKQNADGSITEKGGFHITRITEAGIFQICEQAPDPYYYKHQYDFENRQSYSFSPLQYHRYHHSMDKFYALNRVKLMMLAAGVCVLPDEKPKLEELYVNCLREESEEDYNQYNLGIYRDFDDVQCHRILQRGVFYTMGEVREFLNERSYDGADQISATRIAGVFVNEHTCFVVYIPTAGTNRMIKVNGVAEKAALNLIRNTFSRISDFDREINCCGVSTGDLDALVITNGNALISTMVMGHHLTRKPKIEESEGSLEAISGGTNVVLRFQTPLSKEQTAIFKQELSKIEGVKDLRITEGKRSGLLKMEQDVEVLPKEAIRNAAATAGINHLMVVMAHYDMKLIHFAYGRHSRIFAVNAGHSGVQSLRYLVTHTPEEYRMDRNRILQQEQPFQFCEHSPMDLYAGNLREKLQRMGETEEHIELVDLIYLPVLEIKQLRQIADDFTHPVLGIITFPGLERLISQCLRKDILFFQEENENIQRSANVPRFDRNGYDFDQQASSIAADKEKKPRRRKHRSSFDLDYDLWLAVKAEAKAEGVSINKILSRSIKAKVIEKDTSN